MIVAPHAGFLVSSLRSSGYDIETALADILDNSITAKAKNINLKLEWNEGEPYILIIDDGSGMSEAQLIEAMKFGSSNPTLKREFSDLGRFGLGLKTASLSIGRRLTVASKVNTDNISVKYWDVDQLVINGKWELGNDFADEQAKHRLESTLNNKGTAVLIENIDRIFDDNNINYKDMSVDLEKEFYLIIEKIERHFKLVFQRYLELDLKIYINGYSITPEDPFLSNHIKYRSGPIEIINYKSSKVEIKGHVLPKESLLKESEKKLYSYDMLDDRQGIYLYRNNRLIIYGNWLSLANKKKANKYARVEVNIDNNLDKEFEINFTKSKAKLPISIQHPLKKIVNATIEESMKNSGIIPRKKVVKYYTDPKNIPIWKPINTLDTDKTLIKINRENRLVKELIYNYPDSEYLLKSIERTIPVELIKSNNYQIDMNFYNDEINLKKTKSLINTLIDNQLTTSKIIEILTTEEPYRLYGDTEYYIQLLSTIKKGDI